MRLNKIPFFSSQNEAYSFKFSPFTATFRPIGKKRLIFVSMVFKNSNNYWGLADDIPDEAWMRMDRSCQQDSLLLVLGLSELQNSIFD